MHHRPAGDDEAATVAADWSRAFRPRRPLVVSVFVVVFFFGTAFLIPCDSIVLARSALFLGPYWSFVQGFFVAPFENGGSSHTWFFFVVVVSFFFSVVDQQRPPFFFFFFFYDFFSCSFSHFLIIRPCYLSIRRREGAQENAFFGLFFSSLKPKKNGSLLDVSRFIHRLTIATLERNRVWRATSNFRQVLPSFTGFPIDFTEFHCFFSWMSQGFAGFYRVLLSFTGFLLDVLRFYWVLLGFTEFYKVLPDCTGFYWVLPGFTRFLLDVSKFSWVLPVFTGFYWVLLGCTGFYRVLLGFTGF